MNLILKAIRYYRVYSELSNRLYSGSYAVGGGGIWYTRIFSMCKFRLIKNKPDRAAGPSGGGGMRSGRWEAGYA